MVSKTDREILKKKSASFKDAISHNFNDFKSNTENISSAAMIGGGVLLAGYLIYRMLRSNTSEFDNLEGRNVVIVNRPQESTIVKNIKAAIFTFLLAIAKQKLAEYLNQRENLNNNDNE